MRILVTGANGYVGRNLARFFIKKDDMELVLTSRYGGNPFSAYGEIDENTDWSQLLLNCDLVIHLASIVHTKNASKQDYYKVNVYGTENLIKQAISSGVKKFIYISSVKVHGEKTLPGTCLTEESLCNPQDFYAATKLEAEKSLVSLCKNSSMSYVILRPAMIYGLGSKGNFDSLVKIIKLRLPMPFKNVNNKRSFLFIDNFLKFLEHCIRLKEANNQIYLLSDGRDLSTAELIRAIGNSLGVSVPLLSIKGNAISSLFTLIGLKSSYNKLTSNFCIDCTKALEMLPPNSLYSVSDGIRKSIKTCQKSNKGINR